jgi:hypothetical protein
MALRYVGAFPKLKKALYEGDECQGRELEDDASEVIWTPARCQRLSHGKLYREKCP